jgi:flagellar L-ring protein precursor FlgH
MKRIGQMMGIAAVVAAVSPVSGAAQTTAATQEPTQLQRRSRASWLADRTELRVGDVVTVVVDERVTARERSSKIASADRSQSMGLAASSPDFTLPVTSGNFGTSSEAQSRNVGEANRVGDLTSVFTVSIVGIDETGLFRIQGDRTVVVDGRTQEWTLEGMVRPEDVSADNVVFSNRVANANITYKGKDIGPSKGIIGKILSILWP